MLAFPCCVTSDPYLLDIVTVPGLYAFAGVSEAVDVPAIAGVPTIASVPADLGQCRTSMH